MGWASLTLAQALGMNLSPELWREGQLAPWERSKLSREKVLILPFWWCHGWQLKRNMTGPLGDILCPWLPRKRLLRPIFP